MMKLSFRRLLPLLLALPGLTTAAPQPRAHAHNDYEHPRPLLDALDHGFCSVEADIHLAQGALLVAHDLNRVRPDRTLESLYLIPLQNRAREFQGRIHPGPTPFTLLIDLKSEALSTYAVLRPTLLRYTNILTRFEPDRIHTNAVTIILSGNRPRAVLKEEPVRYAALDGRLEDLSEHPPLSLMPLISDNWTRHFSWRGQGKLPLPDAQKLQLLVRDAHQQGRRLRFWAIPDQPAGWQAMLDHQVDFINTDRLRDLELFLQNQGQPRN